MPLLSKYKFAHQEKQRFYLMKVLDLEVIKSELIGKKSLNICAKFMVSYIEESK